MSLAVLKGAYEYLCFDQINIVDISRTLASANVFLW